MNSSVQSRRLQAHPQSWGGEDFLIIVYLTVIVFVLMCGSFYLAAFFESDMIDYMDTSVLFVWLQPIRFIARKVAGDAASLSMFHGLILVEAALFSTGLWFLLRPALFGLREKVSRSLENSITVGWLVPHMVMFSIVALFLGIPSGDLIMANLVVFVGFRIFLFLADKFNRLAAEVERLKRQQPSPRQ